MSATQRGFRGRVGGGGGLINIYTDGMQNIINMDPTSHMRYDGKPLMTHRVKFRGRETMASASG